MQFLTFHDYLLRNFNLFRLESTYEIREDVMDIVKRINPRLGDDGSCVFHGWARMASPMASYKIVKVAKPNLGETMPSQVHSRLADGTVCGVEWVRCGHHGLKAGGWSLGGPSGGWPIGGPTLQSHPFIPTEDVLLISTGASGLLDEHGPYGVQDPH